METISKQVATNIRVALLRQERSQQTLAEHLGISKAAMSKRLNGHTPIDVDELHRIAGFLGVPVSSLIEEAA